MKKIESGKDTHIKYRREDWINEIRTLLLQGDTKYLICQNMRMGKYPQMEGSETLSLSALYAVIDDAYDTCKIECEEEKRKQRALAYDRFLDLYKEARKKGDRMTAKQVLDSMAKLTGLNEPEKIDIGETTIQIELV